MLRPTLRPMLRPMLKPTLISCANRLRLNRMVLRTILIDTWQGKPGPTPFLCQVARKYKDNDEQIKSSIISLRHFPQGPTNGPSPNQPSSFCRHQNCRATLFGRKNLHFFGKMVCSDNWPPSNYNDTESKQLYSKSHRYLLPSVRRVTLGDISKAKK